MSAATLARLRAALKDRYLVERELGAGGMATVYLAEDLKHKRKVALKVLKPELAAVLGADRFVVEITTTAAMQHPHILPLFDSGASEWVTAAAGGVSPVLAVSTPGLYGLGLANCTTTATNTGTIVLYYGTLQVTSSWRDRA
jgi:serine/threonine protein kinase